MGYRQWYDLLFIVFFIPSTEAVLMKERREISLRGEIMAISPPTHRKRILYVGQDRDVNQK